MNGPVLQPCRREARADHLTRHDSAARELDSGEHLTINNPWPTHQTRD